MWVACDDDRVVALRVLLRWEFTRGGETLRAVRAVDTATDPNYQGRGLFRTLTMHGLDQMREEGVDFLFNTPNSQSLPGYLKMGWQVVGKVPAAFRVRTPLSLTALRETHDSRPMVEQPANRQPSGRMAADSRDLCAHRFDSGREPGSSARHPPQ